MKCHLYTHRIISAALFCCVAFLAKAQNSYMPFLADGKEWRCAKVSTVNRGDTLGQCTIAVIGDTIVNEKRCKKLQASESGDTSVRTLVAYEEDGKLYSFDGSGFVLQVDMSLKSGDRFMAGHVLTVDSIEVRGQMRRRMLIDSGVDHPGDSYLYYAVEGIGLSKDEFLNTLGGSSSNCYYVMLACSENGEVIFTQADFRANTTSISNVFARKGDYRKYGLDGMEVKTGGNPVLYIQDGKKFLWRAIKSKQ